jgi:pimeloyl-ACP methyl ester carboxylesterase
MARCPKVFIWLDSYTTIHRFLNQNKEKHYVRYYLDHCEVQKIIGRPWLTLKRYAAMQFKQHPDRRLRVPFLPIAINRMFDMIGGAYDLRFADTFYDCSWFDGYDREKILSSIRCPSILIHTNWHFTEDGVLMAAMSGEDAQRAHSLIPGNEMVRVDSGHDFHQEKPKEFIKLLVGFADGLEKG